MLRMKWLMVTLSGTLLFTVPTSNLKPFQATEQSIEKQVDLNGVVQVNEMGLIKHPIQVQYEKKKLENEKKAEEERLKKELEEQKKNEPEWQEFIVSFYTGLDEENSIHGAVNCRNLPLERGMVANNVLPYGTKIFLDNDYGIRTVADTGGNNFNSSNRIDLFVARRDGETEDQWKARAYSYGIQKVKGYIIK